MKKTFSAMLLAAVLHAGCTTPLAGSLSSGDATLLVTTSVQSGVFRTQDTGFSPYAQSSINHLVIKLYTLDALSQETPVMSGGAQVQVDVDAAALSQSISFKNLHSNTTYRIKAYAYKAQGTDALNLISTEDANSYRDVTVGNSLTPTITSLPVKLIDRLFNAVATGSIVVIDGAASASEETITPGGSPP